MKICVLTLTRDRLPYTQHCFGRLQELAGVDFEHLILDQGSADGTPEWIRENYPWSVLIEHERNVGIHVGMNELLAAAEGFQPDVIVKFDNDCELVTPGALLACAHAALALNAVCSPFIRGLRNPLPVTGPTTATLHESSMIGGIFLAAPARLYDSFRFDETAPVWGTDDDNVCREAKNRGMLVGYLDGYEANHYLTTDGQVADIPGYFERRVAEGGRPR